MMCYYHAFCIITNDCSFVSYFIHIIVVAEVLQAVVVEESFGEEMEAEEDAEEGGVEEDVVVGDKSFGEDGRV